jgi:hypothetical protein
MITAEKAIPLFKQLPEKAQYLTENVIENPLMIGNAMGINYLPVLWIAIPILIIIVMVYVRR